MIDSLIKTTVLSIFACQMYPGATKTRVAFVYAISTLLKAIDVESKADWPHDWRSRLRSLPLTNRCYNKTTVKADECAERLERKVAETSPSRTSQCCAKWSFKRCMVRAIENDEICSSFELRNLKQINYRECDPKVPEDSWRCRIDWVWVFVGVTGACLILLVLCFVVPLFVSLVKKGKSNDEGKATEEIE